MRIVIACLTLLFGLIGLGAEPASAARRVALVIGNGDYQNVGQLANPTNDATAIAASLKAAGFDDVKLVENLGQVALLRALRDFTATVAGADTAVIYYAGHGVEVAGRNYLVPTDAALANASDVEFEAVSLDAVRTAVSGASKLRIVILDACRNNPFKLASADGKRSIGRGLARIEPGANELIAYAAKEGTVASDGGGGANSPYAASLVKHLADPGLDVRLLFGRVRDDVLSATGGAQEPFIYGTLGGEALVLNPAAPAAPEPVKTAAETPPPPKGISSEAAELWPLVEKTTSCGVLQSFIDRISAEDNAFIGFAEARMKELNCGATAAESATPPAPEAPPPDEAPPVDQAPPEEPAIADDGADQTPISATVTPMIAPVGKWAEGIAFDGRSLWVAESGQRSIARISEKGTVGERVTVGRLPVSMASLPDGRVFALVFTDKLLWQQPPGGGKGKRLASFKDCPQGLAASDRALWVLTQPSCSSEATRAIRVDPATGKQSPTRELGEWGQAIAVGHGKVWVAHASGPALRVIDADSLAVDTREIADASLWSITTTASGVFAGGRMGEDNAMGLLVSIDAATFEERNRLLLNERIAVVAADDERVAAIGENGTIWVASAGDLSMQRVITLSVGPFRPSSALIIGGRLVIVAQQYEGENGAVFVVSDWR